MATCEHEKYLGGRKAAGYALGESERLRGRGQDGGGGGKRIEAHAINFRMD